LINAAEAVIIGGGIIGNSIAYFLTQSGVKPVVIERNDLATGASGACDKAIILSSKNPGLHLQLALASAALYQELDSELGPEIEYAKDGGMIVIENSEQWEAMENFAARQRQIGLNVKMLDKKETREVQPALAEHILGCTYHPDDAEVNPINITLQLAKKARQNGAQYLLHTEATAIKTDGGRVKSVVTSRGSIAAPLVINAAGAWAPGLFTRLGVSLPIRPRKGQLLITEAKPRLIRGDILSAGYIAAKYNPTLAENGDDVYTQLGVGLSLGQMRSGNFIIGATREFVGYDTRSTPQGIAAVARNAVRFVPALAGVNLIRTFAGLRPYTPDGLPILDWVHGIEGLFVAAGHEGDGIALAPITGKLVSQVVTGEKPQVDVTALGIGRFSDIGNKVKDG